MNGVIDNMLSSQGDIDHYCLEMATAKFEPRDAAQVHEIVDYCIKKVGYAVLTVLSTKY